MKSTGITACSTMALRGNTLVNYPGSLSGKGIFNWFEKIPRLLWRFLPVSRHINILRNPHFYAENISGARIPLKSIIGGLFVN